jgi:hypothetical protein
MTSIAKAIWQLQRLGLYEHVQHLRARFRFGQLQRLNR